MIVARALQTQDHTMYETRSATTDRLLKSKKRPETHYMCAVNRRSLPAFVMNEKDASRRPKRRMKVRDAE